MLLRHRQGEVSLLLVLSAATVNKSFRRGKCLDIIEQVPIVYLKIWVFEFPCLARQNHSGHRDSTPSPYGFGLPSSVFRTL